MRKEHRNRLTVRLHPMGHGLVGHEPPAIDAVCRQDLDNFDFVSLRPANDRFSLA